MKYVVWVMEAGGKWRPLPATTRQQADKLAEKLDTEGWSFRIYPAPKYDPSEE